MQKINFTQEEFEKLLALGKSTLQTPRAKKVTKKPKKTVVIEVDDEEDSEEANKENIDLFERSPNHFEQFRKTFRFFFWEKPKLGIDFPNEMVLVLAYIQSQMMDFATHLRTTIMTFLQCFRESHNPKSY